MRTGVHTLPSFKEGYRVNITPVKYHGGRNYTLNTLSKTPDPRKKRPITHSQHHHQTLKTNSKNTHQTLTEQSSNNHRTIIELSSNYHRQRAYRSQTDTEQSSNNQPNGSNAENSRILAQGTNPDTQTKPTKPGHQPRKALSLWPLRRSMACAHHAPAARGLPPSANAAGRSHHRNKQTQLEPKHTETLSKPSQKPLKTLSRTTQ